VIACAAAAVWALFFLGAALARWPASTGVLLRHAGVKFKVSRLACRAVGSGGSSNRKQIAGRIDRTGEPRLD
jgi:hypothetical protein